MLSTLLDFYFLTLLAVSPIYTFTTALNHYVVPTLRTCPPQRKCTDINTLLRNTGQYFTSNTSITFQNSIYIIDKRSFESVLIIQNVSNVVISGEVDELQQFQNHIVFRCHTEFNIIIVNCTNIQVSNIDFLGCGSQITYHKFQHTSIYDTLKLSDKKRNDFTSMFGTGLNLKTPAQAATAYFLECTNVTLEKVTIRNSTKGIALLEVNNQHYFTVKECYFELGYRAWRLEASYPILSERATLYTIEHSRFSTTHDEQSDVFTLISNKMLSIQLTLYNTTIEGRVTTNSRGYIFHAIMLNMKHFLITFEHFNVTGGRAQLNMHDDDPDHDRKLRFTSKIIVKNGYFSRSSLDIDIHQRKPIVLIENFSLKNPITFLAITLDNTAYLHNISIQGCSRYPAIYFRVSQAYLEGYNMIKHCTATNDIETIESDSILYTGGMYCLESKVIFRGEMYFLSNRGDWGGAIRADEQSQLIFEGEVLFENNVAFNGGAIALYEGSWMRIKSTASINFIQNYALNFGGAIYVANNTQKLQYNGLWYHTCIHEPMEWNLSIDYRVMSFINNTAEGAGDIIYATNGEYFLCSFPTFEIIHDNFQTDFGIETFINTIENHQTNLSLFASVPRILCYCTDSQPDCSYVRASKKYFPGQEFYLPIIAAGYGYWSTPASIQARVINNRHERKNSFQSRLQRLQETDKVCTSLKFTMNSLPGTYQLLLSRHYISYQYALQNIKFFEEDPTFERFVLADPPYDEVPLLITIELKNCPAGFQFSNDTYGCICHQKLTQNDIGCNINTQAVHRQALYWIHPVQSGVRTESDIIIHKHCPHNYCNPTVLNINLEDPDKQCLNRRSGILCGACQGNLSMVLGTTRCMECSSVWILLILPVSAIAGLTLAVVLSVLNLTVTLGTINGLIFYANILQPNQASFFPPIPQGTISLTQFTKIFVAWLNLDLGFEVCFYNGLDSFAKILFQLAFPIYIWTIMTLIIVGSHYSTRIARISGRNAVQVLATLFLLSYSKILREIITILSATSLQLPNHTKLVWLQDGNVDYLKGQHIFLFLLALFLLLLLSVPYTSILLLSQCLQRWSDYKLIAWIWRVKPLFDAYTGPLKDNHRYWTGLLLLVRVTLYIVYSTNVGGDPSVNILASAVLLACLLTYLVLVGGVYKSWPLTALECSYLLNVLLLTILTLYAGETQDIYTNTSVMVVALTTSGTIFYHIYLQIKNLRFVRRYIRKREKANDEDIAEVVPPARAAPKVISQIIRIKNTDLKESLLVSCESMTMNRNEPELDQTAEHKD